MLSIYGMIQFVIYYYGIYADHKISLDSLLIQLKSAILSDSDKIKWYQLGKALGTKKELLDKCTRLQPDQSLAEILDDWLRNHSGQPSWNEIAEALTEIGLKQLAYDIKSVYQTGKKRLFNSEGTTKPNQYSFGKIIIYKSSYNLLILFTSL